MPEERLQKLLARAGYGSRRASEKFISAGRVTVNGKVAELGTKANPAKDRILVDGKRIAAARSSIYIALYKPRGVLSTTGGPDKRPKLIDIVPESDQLQIVGRLDRESEGLILLTNDGQLTNWLTHPRYGHEKEYQALVSKIPSKKQLEAWQRGIVMIDGTKSRPAQVTLTRTKGKGAWLKIIMKEGRKRQIREIAGLLGLHVVKLIRVRISSLNLGNLKTGSWRELEESEIRALKSHQKIA